MRRGPVLLAFLAVLAAGLGPSAAGAGAAAPAPAAAAARVRVAWPVAPGALVEPGKRLTVRIRSTARPGGRRPLADVALLATTADGATRAVLARRRARRPAIAVEVPHGASGPARLRVRVGGRTFARALVVLAPELPPPPPGPPPRCAATVGTALDAAAAPAAAPAGGSVALEVRNTGRTCLEGGICPVLEVRTPAGAWEPAPGLAGVCPAIAVSIAPGEVRRFPAEIPRASAPGASYRLRLPLSGPDGPIEAAAPVEVLPAA